MKKTFFTESHQKFNDHSLIVISSTHGGEMYHLDRSQLTHIDSIKVELIPYPEKHGLLSSAGKDGTLQKSGMVYERDYEEEINEYIEKVSQAIQHYIKDHDEEIRNVIISSPAQVKGKFEEELKSKLHNVHISEIHFVEGNYSKMEITETLEVINKKLSE